MEEEEVLQQEQVTQTDPKKEVKQQTPQEFSAKIKSKYPQYKDMDDVELAQKIVAKYPQYEGVVNFDVKKKNLSESTVPNQKLDSEAKDTDGSLATQKNNYLEFGRPDGSIEGIGYNKEKQQQNLADTVNASIPKEEKPKETKSYGWELGKSLEKGSARLGEMFAATPEFLYDIFAIPQNVLSDPSNYPFGLAPYMRKLGVEKLAVDSEKFKEQAGIENKIKDFYSTRVEELTKEQQELGRKYEGTITENFQNGNIEDGFRMLGNAITESLPVSLSIMAGGAAVNTPKLLMGTTVLTGAGSNEEYKKDNPEMDATERTVNSLGKGFAEGVFSTIGTGTIGVAAKEIIAREGVEQGSQILKQNIINIYKEALKKYPIPSAMLGEGLEEAATQMTQNAIDGKPVMDGVSDAFLVGMGSGGAFGTAIEGLKVATKDKSTKDIVKTLDENNLDSEKVKSELEMQVNEGDLKPKEASEIYENFEEVREQLKAVPEDYNAEEKTKAVELLKQRSELEKKIEGKDPTLVETEKARIEEINNELKSIKNPNAQKQESTQEETKSEILPTKNEKVQEVSPKADKTNENVNVKADETEVNATREGINEGKNEGITPVKVQNETTQTENTPTNEGTESNINTREQGVQSKPSETVDKTTVKTIDPEGVKGKFNVTLDENGVVTKIENEKGREIPKWRHDKKTGKPIGKNGNYTRIEAEIYGTKTDNQLKEERQQTLLQALDNFESSSLRDKAIEYFARGGTMKSQDAKSETGYSRSETKWVAKDSKLRPEKDLPSIESVAERLDLENSLDAKNAILEVLQEFKNREEVENHVIEQNKENQEQLKQQELDAYFKSMTSEQFALYEEMKAEEELIENLSDEMAVEYFKDQIAYYEKSKEQDETVKGNEQGREATTTSNDGARQGEGNVKQKEQGEVNTNDDTQAQGVSLNKENNRDSALSKEGAVKQKNARQRAFKRFWNNTFSSTRGLDKKVVREIESLMGDLAAISSALEYEASQFAKMSKQILKQDKKNYNENLKKINDYLSGDTSVDLSFLKDQQKEQLGAFRWRIDTLSDKIKEVLIKKRKELEKKLEKAKKRVEERQNKKSTSSLGLNDIEVKYDYTKDASYNVIQESINRIDALIETIEGNKGKYMFRQYDAFSNDKYLDGLTGKYPNNAAKKRLYNAIEYVSKEEGITKDEAKTQILEYLDSLKGNNDFVSATATGKAKAPFLKRRKDIPEPIRELLGESKDPVKNYIATVLNMSKYIANIEYQSRLADALNKTGLSKDKIEPGYTKLIKSSEGWDLLQDIYVPDEVAESIEDLQPLDSIQDDVYRGLVQLAAVTKLGKTVLSPTTTARNLLSGIFLSLNNGFNPFRNPKRFVRAIQHSWGTKKTNTELKAENQRLIKLGIIKDGAVSREVLGILNDARLPVDKILKKNALEKFLDVMQKAYALGDDAYKAVGFYVWEKRYKDAGLSDADAEIAAADRIRNGFPTYSKIPKNIQKLRRIPLVGTFPSFAYEVWRTSFNNVRFIGQDIKAATTDSNGDMKPVKEWDKRRLLMAHQQATGMIIANSMAYALSSLSMALLGISDEEDETTKNMSAPWQKDSTNIYIGEENGNYQVIDASAFFPSETMFEPVRILTEQRKGRDINDKILLSLNSATDAFFQTDIFAQTAMDLITNKNGYGQEIYKGDSFMEGIGNDKGKIINYALKQAGPGIYNNISEFARANEVFPDYFGNKETSYKEYTNTEALMGLMGIRLSRINYINGINSIAYDTKDKYQKARNETLSEIKSTKKMSDEDIQNLVKDYKDYNKEYHKQVILSVNGAKKQGIEKQKIEKALKNAGYSNEDISRIYMGQDPFLKPLSTTTFKRKMDKIDIGRFSNDKAKLKEIKENIAKKTMLFNKYVYEANVKNKN